ncbi:hypothetical protein T06_4687 [Trichinella sp. T6]|nr:hypothetical protein T06_4687 [Trichinella sp. T6]
MVCGNGDSTMVKLLKLREDLHTSELMLEGRRSYSPLLSRDACCGGVLYWVAGFLHKYIRANAWRVWYDDKLVESGDCVYHSESVLKLWWVNIPLSISGEKRGVRVYSTLIRVVDGG